jgi:hypothetical protein
MKNQEQWDLWVANNTDPYSGTCVNVARQVMKLLDEDPTPLHHGYYPDIHTAHGLICKADDDVKAGGITGYMASMVAQMVVECHERGEEFRISHNGRTYKGDGVVNKAIITI